MTSAINYSNINENFPIAGQDNDTQVFRDNFDTIKRSLQSAYTEVTDLQTNTAKLNVDNDFEKTTTTNVVFQNVMDKKFDGGSITTDFTVDYENGPYQILRFGADINLEFLNFPTNSDPLVAGYGVGKAVLELYGDGTERTITLVSTGGTVFKKNADFPTTLTVESSDNPVLVEVWQHSTDIIFLKYLGVYS